jgi:Fuc2NAc and GlcNAc transferase
MWIVALLFATAAASLAITEAVRRYALAHGVLDRPNHRSAHTSPTPTGGGLAIVAAFLAGVTILSLVGRLDVDLALALSGSGAIVATVGIVDDYRTLAPQWRLVAQFVAAAWALVFLDGPFRVVIAGTTVAPGLLGDIAAVLFLVWMTNLYNFMDGIDGIAGVEAVSVGACVAAVYAMLAPLHPDLPLAGLLVAAALGFLGRNWPPAAIFMGDAGSGFLGMTMGVLVLHGTAVDHRALWVWLILLAVFLVDTGVTLGRRLAAGERVYEPHRNHAYQHAARHAGAHTPVTLGVAAINVFWLLPIALAVGASRLEGVSGVAIAVLPLVWLAAKYGAGAPEST